jgi:hypothetical protein
VKIGLLWAAQLNLCMVGAQAAALMAKWPNACCLRPCYWDIDSVFDASGQKLPNPRFNREDIVRFHDSKIALKLSIV